jgi:hypothetical protein
MRSIVISFCICLITLDSQAQWNEVAVPSDNHLYAVDIYTGGICYAGGIDFIRSTDAGDTWTEIIFTGPSAVYLDFFVIYSIRILDINTIVCAGWHGTENNNVIIRSTDGGINWAVEYAGTFGNGKSFNHLEFYDAVNGVVVGDNGMIFRTTDAGDNWVQVASGTSEDLRDVCYTSSLNNLVAVGDEVILRSTTAGTSWTLQPEPLNVFMSVQYDPSGNTTTAAYLPVSLSGTYMKSSTNEGVTWTSAFLYDDDVRCHEMVDADTMHFGNENLLYTTHNGAGDFFYINSNDLGITRDIEVKYGVGLAVTADGNGRVFKYDDADVSLLAPEFEIEYPALICEDTPVMYVCTNGSADSYEWQIGGITVSTNDTLYFSHPTAGSETVELFVTHNGITHDDAQVVTVAAGPVVVPFTFSGDTTRCVGNTGSFWVNSIAGQTGFQVYKDGVPINFSASSGNNRQYNLGTLTVNCVIDIVKWSVNSCDSAALEQTVNFIVEPYDNAGLDFYMTDTLLCLNDQAELILPVSNPGFTYYAYNNGDGMGSQAGNADTLIFATGPLNSSHSFTVVSTSLVSECLTLMTNSEVVALDPVSAGFTIVPVYSWADVPLELNTTAVIGTIYDWSGTGSPQVVDGNTLTPVIVYDTTGLEYVTLEMENATGCKDSVTQAVELFNLPPDSSLNYVCWFEEKNLPVVLDKHVDYFGNVIVVGYRYAGNLGWGPLFLACIQKYNSNGDLLWEWDHPSTGYDKQRSTMIGNITSDAQGNYYMTGAFQAKEFEYMGNMLFSQVGTMPRRTFLMKITGDGDLVWFCSTPAPGSNRGYADILYDHGTANLFVSSTEMSTVHNFPTGTVDLSAMGNISVMRIDTSGVYHENWGIFCPTSNAIGQAEPENSSSSKSTQTSPDLLKGHDGMIYLFGEIFDDYIYTMPGPGFEIDAISTQERRTYIAKLDVYGSSPGWLNLVQTAQYSPVIFGSSDRNEDMQLTIDSDNNFYVSLNGGYTFYTPVIGPDTMSINIGGFIAKFDANLNYVWSKEFKPVYIHDILYAMDGEIFFTGRFNDYMAELTPDGPGALLNPAEPNQMFVGSIDTAGNITWLEAIGGPYHENGNVLAGNYCGDVYFSGRIKDGTLYFNPLESADCSLSGVNYGVMNGNFMFKLTDSVCVSGGCQTLCLDPAFDPSPVVTFNDSLLSTGVYDTYQWFLNGDTIPGATNQTYAYTQNGTYTVTVSDANGCTGTGDAGTSCLNEDYFVEPMVTHTTFDLSTGSYAAYQWYLNGTPVPGATAQTYVYTQNGTYSVIVTDNEGCIGEAFASTSCLNVGLMVVPVISQSVDTLYAGNSYVIYQWYLDGIPLSGETDAYLVYSQNGAYTVEVTDVYGCMATSDAYTVSDAGLNGIAEGADLMIYPNPTTNRIFIRIPGDTDSVVFGIFDSAGRAYHPEVRCVHNNVFEIVMNDLADGFYFVTVSAGDRYWKENIVICR